MRELAWIFGKSSDFSQKIIEKFEQKNISVYSFGRENIDYNNFDNFLMMKVLPDYIVLNANIEEQIALQIDKNNFSNIHPSQTQEMFDAYNPVFLFFVKLFRWLESQGKSVSICAISSSITAWPYKENKYLMYAVLRSMLQQVVFSASNNVCNAFCVSPSGIDTTNINEYAERIVELCLNRTDLKLIDLSMDQCILNLENFKDE